MSAFREVKGLNKRRRNNESKERSIRYEKF